MKPTLEYIESKFTEYNKMMFGGRLKALPFRLSSARTFLGKVTFQKRRGVNGKWRYSNFTFVISNRLDLPEEEVEDTIIHEMIHYYILSNQLQDDAPHGTLFHKMMNGINQRFGRQVSVSHKRTAEDCENDKMMRAHYICITKLNDGRVGVTVAAKSRLFLLWDDMKCFVGIKEQYWVGSTDPYFNRFPRALTPKLYSVPADELNIHLETAVELERVGNVIRPKR